MAKLAQLGENSISFVTEGSTIFFQSHQNLRWRELGFHYKERAYLIMNLLRSATKFAVCFF